MIQFKSFIKKESIAYHLPVLVTALLCFALWFLPTGFEGAEKYQTTHTAKALVLSTDDSAIVDTGLIRGGEQRCTLEILDGEFKGKQGEGINMLSGSLELDKLFVKGDKALVRLNLADGEILTISMVDHYRMSGEFWLLLAFFGFLILFAGMTGLRAILSFGLSVLLIWKVLIPSYLKGYDPIIVGSLVTGFLTVMIIALVFGFDRRWGGAVIGSIAGIITTGILGIWSTTAFQIHGAVLSYSESLLYSGYQHLNLTGIFMAAIFIGSSGAMMDLAVDITSAVHEVVQKKSDLSVKEGILSGIRVGRAAMGTMTTTLLLAYSGGFIGLLMVFMAQGTPMVNILNYKYVAAELIHTLVGSFGLVLVAPFTAISAGYLLCGRSAVAPAEHYLDR